MRLNGLAIYLLFAWISLSSSVFAQTTPPAGETLIGGIDVFKPGGPKFAELGRYERVAVTDQPFTEAIRVQTNGTPGNRWDVMIQGKVTQTINEGDVLLARFWVRTIEALAADGVVAVAVELNRSPWDKLAEGQYSAPRTWTQIQLPVLAPRAFEGESVNVSLCLGFSMQTVEIGGVELIRLPPGTKFDSLPRSDFAGYRGMEADAKWRKEALARIDRIRKGDLRVRVVDSSGAPVANKAVHISLQRHAFRFGTAVDARLMLADTPSSEVYRQQVATHFNTVVYENDLKWLSFDGSPDRIASVDNTLPWFADRKIRVHGHVLVWPAFRWLPPRIAALRDNPVELRQAINEHITSVVTRYRGKFDSWDVLNEPFNNTDLEKILGREAFVEWFKLARQADPDVKLFLNDFGLLESGNQLDTAHQRFDDELIQYLLDQKAPIGGIGMQGHFGSNVTEPEKLLAILDRFGRFGLPIRITELDVNILDEQLRARYLRDLFIVCFSHPSVEGVLQWGFWEGRHWLPGAAPFARNWSLRPHGQAWQQLMSQWTTDATIRTASDGAATIRGFVGDYSIQIDGQTKSVTLPLEGAEMKWVLEH